MTTETKETLAVTAGVFPLVDHLAVAYLKTHLRKHLDHGHLGPGRPEGVGPPSGTGRSPGSHDVSRGVAGQAGTDGGSGGPAESRILPA